MYRVLWESSSGGFEVFHGQDHEVPLLERRAVEDEVFSGELGEPVHAEGLVGLHHEDESCGVEDVEAVAEVEDHLRLAKASLDGW